MSVWLVAIEKEEGLPWASFYLGESKAEQVMKGIGSPLHHSGPVKTLHRMDHYPVTVEQASALIALLKEEDALHEDHEADDAKEFLEGMKDFSFREEYVLYVEVA